jgi:hypothetical protein
MQLVVAQDVARVLAEEALDALPELGDPVDVLLSMALEPAEPLIAAMSAKARLIPGRLLPTVHPVPAIKEQPGPS